MSEPYKNPFTIVDSRKAIWTIRTDKVQLLAIKEVSPHPRFRGDISQLNTLLQWLKLTPANMFEVDRGSLKSVPEFLRSVLGVVVNTIRLQDLVEGLPEGSLLIGNFTTEMNGVPTLGLKSRDSIALLAGYADVDEEVLELPLVPPVSLFDQLMADEI